MSDSVTKPDRNTAMTWNSAVLQSVMQCTDPDFVEFLTQMFFFEWWENE